MKIPFLIISFFLSISLFGQVSEELIKGNVSYMSSQNVYVKFVNTDGIHIGDSLFLVLNDKPVPVLIVTSLSSISCVGTPISTNSLTVSTQIIAKIIVKNATLDVIAEKSKESLTVNDLAIKAVGKKEKEKDSKSRFDGRLSVSSYTNISNYVSNQRFRYNLSMNAEHIGNSNLYAESYITFTHMLSFPAKPTDWLGINNALKIYTLALKYDLNKTSTISFGRKINNNMANIGAVDGLQFEKVNKNFTYGALVGSRPDYFDYSFNPKLLQFGAFVSQNIQKENGNMQTSFAVFNQMNNFMTDRRFAYLQHSNSLLKNVDLFCSFEIDLYSKIDSVPKNTFNLTSTYISLRYKPWKQLSMSLSYDARKNIYYYETFKSQIDSILDKTTRQGFRFSTIIRPFKYFMLGGNASYRLPTYQQYDSIASINASGYMNYSQLPFNIYGTITATGFKASNTNGSVFGISLNRDFISGKVNAGFEYRLANYQFKRSDPVLQNIAEFTVSWRIAKKLMLSADFEATFEKTTNGINNNAGRAFINISQRF